MFHENTVQNYRATPHCSTGAAPAELLFNRPFRTKLPQVPQQRITKDAQIRENDKEAKDKMKNYGDRFHRKQLPIKIGDTVLVKQPMQSKVSTPFNPRPLEVVDKKGSMITAKDSDLQVTQNSSHFKQLPDSLKKSFNKNEENTSEHVDISEGEQHSPVYQFNQELTASPRKANNHVDDFYKHPQRNRKPPVKLKDYCRTIYIRVKYVKTEVMNFCEHKNKCDDQLFIITLYQ